MSSVQKHMSEEEALAAAREYLRTWLDVTLCTTSPTNLYAFDPKTEVLFEVRRDGPLMGVGKSTYLAVSRATGSVGFYPISTDCLVKSDWPVLRRANIRRFAGL
jgi:hypothetical protein